MTLNGVISLILRYFIEFGSFRGAQRESGRIYLNFLQQKCSPEFLVFSDISLMMI